MSTARNRDGSYGWVTKSLHWLMVLAVIGMFALGHWMVDLDYYHPWYRLAAMVHEGVGLLLAALLLFWILWRSGGRSPDKDFLKPYERILSGIVQWVMLALLVGIMVSGYLTATADGRGIDLFGLVEIPALYPAKGIEKQTGELHDRLTHILIWLAAVHMLAALKHHFIDRNAVLTRMLPWGERKKP